APWGSEPGAVPPPPEVAAQPRRRGVRILWLARELAATRQPGLTEPGSAPPGSSGVGRAEARPAGRRRRVLRAPDPTGTLRSSVGLRGPFFFNSGRETRNSEPPPPRRSPRREHAELIPFEVELVHRLVRLDAVLARPA